MKLSKLTITILALGLATIIGWLSYSIFRIQKQGVKFGEIDSRYTQPLNPNLDTKLLDKLNQRGEPPQTE